MNEHVIAGSSMTQGATQQVMTLAALPSPGRAGPQSSTPGTNARTVVRGERVRDAGVSLVVLMLLCHSEERSDQESLWNTETLLSSQWPRMTRTSGDVRYQCADL